MIGEEARGKKEKMTNEEAIKRLNGAIVRAEYTDDLFADLVDIEALKMAIEALKKEREKGKWISELIRKEDWKGNMQSYYQPISCSLCHTPQYEESRYCPNCGAKMDFEEIITNDRFKEEQ